MWNNNVRLDFFEELLYSNRFLLENILEGEVSGEIFNSKVKVLQEMNAIFPEASAEDKLKILILILKAYFRGDSEQNKLIWSGPSVAGLPGRDTELVFEEYIGKAKNSIIITIYSLSEYAGKLLELLKKKALQGVYIEVYINDYNNKKILLNDLLSINSKRLFLYEYIGAQNRTQALHAKVLTIDDETSIITSSNLSYNGLDGNLELGVIVESKEKSKEIRAIFNSLIQKKHFKRIRNE